MEAERAPGPLGGRPPPRTPGRPGPAPAPAALRTEAPGLRAERPGPSAESAPPQGPAVGGGFARSELAPPREPELWGPGSWAGAAPGPPKPSAHIPVPAQRAPHGKARPDEVMAAAALTSLSTSLSTSPLLLGAPAVAFSPEAGLEPWKEALARPPGSYSSSNSGDWGWDLASGPSSPSTPSPPLPPEAAHFLFGEPAPRKRKGSAQVTFQCLWKSCGKVLRTAAAMQRHIRVVHLGRQAESEQSDGEEDFYYTELDVGVDVLTHGLSSLTPVSPTASMPPALPRLQLPAEPEPPALPSVLQPLASPPPPAQRPVIAQQVCHIHSDHAYQEATQRCQEVPEGVWHGAPRPVVHSVPLEEGLPALPGLTCRGAAPSPALPQPAWA
ncbi:SLC2A4 regulator isoform X2 [Dasypus novemcinctus]|uniref:SLC2A4 regulator isoform X2 n=1 Tax=Dasypus novemcinctus TaxID=9361 RepID=UPI00265DF05F|nr:SLC2A4 regulator isoform X2 [Dasypus novemcinctus]